MREFPELPRRETARNAATALIGETDSDKIRRVRDGLEQWDADAGRYGERSTQRDVDAVIAQYRRQHGGYRP